MFGVYFINHGDDHWTLVESMPTLERAKKLMCAFKELMETKFNRPPYCVAISKGHTEDYIPRDELSATRPL